MHTILCMIVLVLLITLFILRSGALSKQLSSFITTHLLPNACQVGGTLYCRPPTQVLQALLLQQGVWQLYQQVQSNVSFVQKDFD